MERPTERLSNTGPDYEVRDPYGERQHGGWPTRRGYMIKGEWHAVDARYEQFLTDCGVPPEITWSDFHEFYEDLESYLEGKATYTATPESVARCGLLKDVTWHWVAKDQIFRGWKRRNWENYGRKDEALVGFAERLLQDIEGAKNEHRG